MKRVRYACERAFEAYLRERRLPYVRVHEARRALLPGDGANLKNFDFMVYAPDQNLLVEVKGRHVGGRWRGAKAAGQSSPRMECWVTEDDVQALSAWEGLFGEGFEGAFAFVYACAAQPPDGVFEEVFRHGSGWFGLRVVRVADYALEMRRRSSAWRTVELPRAALERSSRGLVGAGARAG